MSGAARMSASVRGIALKIAFVLFLALVCIGTRPQAVFGVSLMEAGAVQAGEGDPLKQLLYLVICLFAVGTNLLAPPKARGAAIPVSILIFMAWAWASLGWSYYPATAVRRLVLLSIVIVTTFSLVRALGVRSCLTLISNAAVVLLVANFVAVAVLPGAQQEYTQWDLSSSPTDTWRGFHMDKNAAGVVGVVQAFLFIFRAVQPGLQPYVRAAWLLAMLGALAFVWGTGSKSSLGLLVPAVLGAAALLPIAGSRAVALALAVGSAVVISLVLIVDPSIFATAGVALRDLLNSPRALTGRVEIWLMALRYIGDNFWLGSGYGSFWQVGPSGPVFRYGAGWLHLMPNAHNGYLDLAVQLGIVGAVLGAAAGFLVPLYSAVAYAPMTRSVRWLALSVIFFAAAHNLLEATLFNRDNTEFVLLVVMIAIVSAHRTPLRKPVPRRVARDPHISTGAEA